MINSPKGESGNFNRSSIYPWIATFLDLIFPINCRTCYKKLSSESVKAGYICEDCWKSVDYIRLPYCLRCGHPAGDGFSEKCEECKSIRPIYFSKSRGIAQYSGVIRKTIHFWKYEYKQDLTNPLQYLMAKYIQITNDIPEADLIIPVPLHPVRLREREFNQAELLGEPIANLLKVPMMPDILKRTRYTRPQMELSAEERWKNVEGLFTSSNMNFLKGKKILLVDDVMTTGATVNECSRVLMEAGAKEVQVLVLARGK